MSFADTVKVGENNILGLMETGLERQAKWLTAPPGEDKCNALSVLVMWVLDMDRRGYGHILPASCWPRSIHSS